MGTRPAIRIADVGPVCSGERRSDRNWNAQPPRAPFDTPILDRAAYDAALYSYALSARLFKDALVEYRAHIEKYKSFASVYFVHVDDAFSGELLMMADHDYLAAASATGPERRRLLNSAGGEYYAAMQHFAVTVLKYYVDEPVMAAAFPKDPTTGLQYTRATIENSDPKTCLPTLQAVEEANARILVDPATHRVSANAGHLCG